MVNLVIDIGNTFTKIAVFNNNDLIYTEHYTEVDADIINKFLNGQPIRTAIICTVKKEKEQWHTILKDNTHLIYFTAAMATGIRNQYLTPQTLGLDRIAAVAGAHHLYRNRTTW